MQPAGQPDRAPDALREFTQPSWVKQRDAASASSRASKRGVAGLLEFAGAADTAGYVTVGSGEHMAMLARKDAEDQRVLIALEHEGAASPRQPARVGG